MRDLIIFGAGGFAQEVAWIAEAMGEWRVLGYVDDNPAAQGRELYGYKVLEPGALDRLDPAATWFHCAIGKNDARETVAKRLEQRGLQPATLVHPSAIIAKQVTIGAGAYVAPGVIASPMVTIGRFALINQRVSIGHDTTVGDFAQLCPGAQVNASCKLDHGAFVGSNASIHQGRKLGAFCVVGANAQVIRDVPAKTTVAGVPAQILSRAD